MKLGKNIFLAVCAALQYTRSARNSIHVTTYDKYYNILQQNFWGSINYVFHFSSGGNMNFSPVAQFQKNRPHYGAFILSFQTTFTHNSPIQSALSACDHSLIRFPKGKTILILNILFSFSGLFFSFFKFTPPFWMYID